MVEPTNAQSEILSKLYKWLEFKLSKTAKNRNRYRNYVTLGGYAGTGKTTLIAHLRKQLSKQQSTKDIKIAFASYTGKAVQVLKTKLDAHQAIQPQDICTTIHSLIYQSDTDSSGNILGWQRKKTLNATLIVIDEGSMLTRDIWEDLIRFGIPLIVVGDHGQLPPIGDDFNLMKKPDLELNEIHRQAGENPIIRLSELIREQRLEDVAKLRELIQSEFGDFSPNKYIQFIDKTDPYEGGLISEIIQSDNNRQILLCGFNHTRNKLNNYIRGVKFMDDYLDLNTPQVGDRVICLKNNHTVQIFNGMIGELAKIQPHTEHTYFVEVEFKDYQKTYRGIVASQQFGAKTSLSRTQLYEIKQELAEVEDKTKTTHKHSHKSRGVQSYARSGSRNIEVDLFDFGYALTVHKAQGSQAHKVVIFAERFKQMSSEDWIRWLYTAVTRAEEELVLVY